jgi:hypothetical protein
MALTSMKQAVLHPSPELVAETHSCPPANSDAQKAVWPMKWWMTCLLGFVAVYAVIFCAALPSFIDEAYSSNLATDTSLAHVFAALRGGADGTFPLYALIIFSWEKVFGSSEMALRLSSALFVLGFVWQTGRRLARYFGPAVSSLAVVFVLANWAFTFYGLQIRFYGLVIFLFSLCFWSTWDLVQAQRIPARRLATHALLCGLLCLSHPLGLVYAATLGLVYLIVSLWLKRFSFAGAAAFLGGPALFLLWLPSFLSQRLVNPLYPAGQSGLGRFWDFAFYGSTVLVVTLFAGLALFIITRWFSKSVPAAPGSEANDMGDAGGRRLAVSYSLIFIVCLNGMIALLDSLHIVSVYWTGEGGIRYGLVCWAAFAVIVAAIFSSATVLLQKASDRFGIRFSQRVQFIVVLIGLLLLMDSNWGGWYRLRSNDRSYLAKISAIAKEKHLDVVCQRHWDAFYLATRTGTEHVQYLMSDGFAYKHLMLQIAKYYPNPAPVDPAVRAQCTNEYLFLSYSPRDAWIVGKR